MKRLLLLGLLYLASCGTLVAWSAEADTVAIPAPSEDDASVVLSNIDDESRSTGLTDKGVLPVTPEAAPPAATARAEGGGFDRTSLGTAYNANAGLAAGNAQRGVNPDGLGTNATGSTQGGGWLMGRTDGGTGTPVATAPVAPVVPVTPAPAPATTASVLDNPDLLNARLAQYRDHMVNDAAQAAGLPANPALVRRYLATNRASYINGK